VYRKVKDKWSKLGFEFPSPDLNIFEPEGK
jgi:hypothetical protein